ncbi:hypothetical protein GCM10009661_28900 [Catellatospora chokoriensis]|uniref:hypothetical protein n=1 Tax=Catellatospora chokoriensis TaxID=310353 RepID=UPI0031D567E2
MDIGQLDEVADLFRRRLEPLILALLATQSPRKFRGIGTELLALLGGHLDDNAITRALAGLTKRGLIVKASNMAGRRDFPDYWITRKGHQRHAVYCAILAAYAKTSQAAAGSSTTATVHDIGAQRDSKAA